MKGGCTEKRRKECAGRSGPFIHKLCESCEDAEYEPDPYVSALYTASLLRDAGFPFDADDYDLSFWLDLGIFRRSISSCPVL